MKRRRTPSFAKKKKKTFKRKQSRSPDKELKKHKKSKPLTNKSNDTPKKENRFKNTFFASQEIDKPPLNRDEFNLIYAFSGYLSNEVETYLHSENEEDLIQSQITSKRTEYRKQNSGPIQVLEDVETNEEARDHIATQNTGYNFTVSTPTDWLALANRLSPNRPNAIYPCDLYVDIWGDGLPILIPIREGNKVSNSEEEIEERDKQNKKNYNVFLLDSEGQSGKEWREMGDKLDDLARSLEAVILNKVRLPKAQVLTMGDRILGACLLKAYLGQGAEALAELEKFFRELGKQELFENKFKGEFKRLTAEFLALTFGVETSRLHYMHLSTLIFLENLSNGYTYGPNEETYSFLNSFSRVRPIEGKNQEVTTKAFISEKGSKYIPPQPYTGRQTGDVKWHTSNERIPTKTGGFMANVKDEGGLYPACFVGGFDLAKVMLGLRKESKKKKNKGKEPYTWDTLREELFKQLEDIKDVQERRKQHRARDEFPTCIAIYNMTAYFLEHIKIHIEEWDDSQIEVYAQQFVEYAFHVTLGLGIPEENPFKGLFIAVERPLGELIHSAIHGNKALVDNSKEILEAIEKGEIEKVKACLSKSVLIDYLDKDSGETMLHKAIKQQNLELIVILLNKGANPDIRSDKGVTPIQLAEELAKEHKESGELIVNALKEAQLKRPLSISHLSKLLLEVCQNEPCDLEKVKSLIARRANVNIQLEGTKETPLHLAIKSGNIELVGILLDRGANIDIQNVEMASPLNLAANLKEVKQDETSKTIHELLQQVANEKLQKEIERDANSRWMIDEEVNELLRRQHEVGLHNKYYEYAGGWGVHDQESFNNIFGKQKDILGGTEKSILESDKPFVVSPVNIGRNHWACVIYDKVNNTVFYFDSKGNHQNSASKVEEKLRSEFPGLTFVHVLPDQKLQKDSDACGTWMAEFTDKFFEYYEHLGHKNYQNFVHSLKQDDALISFIKNLGDSIQNLSRSEEPNYKEYFTLLEQEILVLEEYLKENKSPYATFITSLYIQLNELKDKIEDTKYEEAFNSLQVSYNEFNELLNESNAQFALNENYLSMANELKERLGNSEEMYLKHCENLTTIRNTMDRYTKRGITIPDFKKDESEARERFKKRQEDLEKSKSHDSKKSGEAMEVVDEESSLNEKIKNEEESQSQKTKLPIRRIGLSKKNVPSLNPQTIPSKKGTPTVKSIFHKENYKSKTKPRTESIGSRKKQSKSKEELAIVHGNKADQTFLPMLRRNSDKPAWDEFKKEHEWSLFSGFDIHQTNNNYPPLLHAVATAYYQGVIDFDTANDLQESIISHWQNNTQANYEEYTGNKNAWTIQNMDETPENIVDSDEESNSYNM